MFANVRREIREREKEMQRPNVAIVIKVYEALGRKDARALAEFCAQDIEIHQSAELPWGGDYQGAEQAMGFFGKVASFIDSKLTIDHILDAGDSVAVIGRTAGKVKATGADFDVPIVHHWTLRDSKITGLTVLLDNVLILPALAHV